METIKNCGNCFKKIDSSKIILHEAYCFRHIKKCQECDMMLNKNCLKDHKNEYHKKIICNYCEENFEISKKESHLEICKKIPKKCLYCQLNYPVNLFNTHFEICSNRTKSCNYCQKFITNKFFEKHQEICVLEFSKKVNCKSCNKMFKKKNNYKKEEGFICKKCSIPHKIITKKNIDSKICYKCMKKINHKIFNTHIKMCGIAKIKKKICKFCKNSVLEKRMESHKNFCIKLRKKKYDENKKIKENNKILDFSMDFKILQKKKYDKNIIENNIEKIVKLKDNIMTNKDLDLRNLEKDENFSNERKINFQTMTEDEALAYAIQQSQIHQ